MTLHLRSCHEVADDRKVHTVVQRRIASETVGPETTELSLNNKPQDRLWRTAAETCTANAQHGYSASRRSGMIRDRRHIQHLTNGVSADCLTSYGSSHCSIEHVDVDDDRVVEEGSDDKMVGCVC